METVQDRELFPAWMLRRCHGDGSSSHGFVWPVEGPVEAPDWDPNPNRDCGGGLHGLPNAEGDWGLMEGTRWQIVHYNPADGEVKSYGKVRIRRGVVETVKTGDLFPRLLELRGNLEFKSSLTLTGWPDLTSIPGVLSTEGQLVLTICDGLTSLPSGLRVGDLVVHNCKAFSSLPEDIQIRGSLYLIDCPNLTSLPQNLKVGRGLTISSCDGLTSLPKCLNAVGWIWIQDCPNLEFVPDSLKTREDCRFLNCPKLLAQQASTRKRSTSQ